MFTSPPGVCPCAAWAMAGTACASTAMVASSAVPRSARRDRLRLEIIDLLVLFVARPAGSGAGARAKAGMLERRLRRGRGWRQHARGVDTRGRDRLTPAA